MTKSERLTHAWRQAEQAAADAETTFQSSGNRLAEASKHYQQCLDFMREQERQRDEALRELRRWISEVQKNGGTEPPDPDELEF
jgi:cysteinyl-tRNA synthetase